jgi:hypothetical protein
MGFRTNDKTEVVAVRVNKELYDRIAEHKERTLVPVGAFVRRAIEEKLERESAK